MTKTEGPNAPWAGTMPCGSGAYFLAAHAGEDEESAELRLSARLQEIGYKVKLGE